MKIKRSKAEPQWKGKHVEIQYCNGRYGSTRKVRGVVDGIDIYGGILLLLDKDTIPFRDYPTNSSNGWLGGVAGKPGELFYITINQEVLEHGEFVHRDFEHGHTQYIRELED